MTTNSQAMSIETAASCLVEYMKADIPVFLWGAPGIGKSEVIDQVAKSLDLPVIDFRASLRDPVDLRGLPLVDAKNGSTRWLPPSELPDAKRHGERGVLKLDELNVASQAVQTACFGLVLERRVGEYELPKGWVIVAAGNRLADRASAQRMPTALRNRFAHLEVEPSLDAWSHWASKSGVHPAVIAFVRFRPEFLHKMPEGEQNGFPTPRSWVKVAKITDAPDATRMHLVSGLIGEGPATEFEAFMRIWKQLPSIDGIFRDPKSVHVPPMGEPAALYAVSAALARRATKDNIAKAYEYAKRMPPEFTTLMMTDAIKRDPKLKETKAFTEWAVNAKEVTL